MNIMDQDVECAEIIMRHVEDDVISTTCFEQLNTLLI